MARKTVVDAVEARLASLWTHCPVVGVNDGKGEPPADASPFLVVQFPAANDERVTINQGFYREEGGFRFVLHTERGLGKDEALTWIEELAVMFRDQKFGGVITQVPSAPLLDDNNDRGNFFVTSIAVPFTYNYS